MPNLADYLVLARHFTLRGGSPNIGDGGGRITLTFARPNNVLISGDLATSPILSFTADVDGGKLSLAVSVNGRPVKSSSATQDFVTFTEGQPVTYHMVLDGQDLFANNERNTIEFIAGIHAGTVSVRDVILWMQKQFDFPN